jgi:hypothetical protein
MANKVSYHGVVIDEAGNGILATVSVYDAGTSTLSIIYSSPLGAVQTNPLATDAVGRFVFYADPGEYDITISGSGIVPYTLENVSIIGIFDQFVTSNPPSSNYQIKKIRLDSAKKIVVVYDGTPEA